MSLHEHSRDFISRCVADQDAYGLLCRLCDDIGPRLSADEGEARAVDAFLAHFAGLGFDTETEEFGYDAWKFGAGSVVAKISTGALRFASNPLGWSPQATVSAPLEDLGYGLEEDIQAHDIAGKVVLVSDGAGPGQKGVHRSVKYKNVTAAGASGFLFYPSRPGGLVPMGSINLEALPGTIPAAGISYEDAMTLRRAGGAEIELSTDCRIEPSVSHNGIAYRKGSGPGEIVVCGHIDTWKSVGAVDNGSGIAAMMELGRLLAPYELKKGVRFIAFGSEELGLLGSKNYTSTREDLSAITCVLNLDCVAIKGGRPIIATQDNLKFHTFWEGLARDLHLDLELHRQRTSYSDHQPFRDRDVPSAALFAGGSSFGFAHTSCDTLDKLAVESFTIPLLIVGVCIIECAMASGLNFRP